MKTGIDSLYIWLSDYEILENFHFDTLQAGKTYPGEKATNNYPIQTKSGVQMVSKCFLNVENSFHVDIQPISPKIPNAPIVCKVHLSLPKFHSGNNFAAIDYGLTEQVLKDLEAELRTIGIATNIFEATLKRVDVFNNVQCEHRVKSYVDVFKLLKASRMQKIEYGQTGFLLKNGQHQTAFYDKLEEMKIKKRSIVGLPKNILRVERRLSNSKKILKTTGLATCQDLARGGGDVLPQHFRESVETVFAGDIAESEVLTDDETLKEMAYFKAKGDRNWWLMPLLIDAILIDATFETVKENVSKVASNKMDASRQIRKLETLRKEVSGMRRQPGQRATIAELHNEIRDKLLG